MLFAFLSCGSASAHVGGGFTPTRIDGSSSECAPPTSNPASTRMSASFLACSPCGPSCPHTLSPYIGSLSDDVCEEIPVVMPASSSAQRNWIAKRFDSASPGIKYIWIADSRGHVNDGANLAILSACSGSTPRPSILYRSLAVSNCAVCNNTCRPANARPPYLISMNTPTAMAKVNNILKPSEIWLEPKYNMPMPLAPSAINAQTTIRPPRESKYSLRNMSAQVSDFVLGFSGPFIRGNKGFRLEWAVLAGVLTGLLVIFLNYCFN